MTRKSSPPTGYVRAEIGHVATRTARDPQKAGVGLTAHANSRRFFSKSRFHEILAEHEVNVSEMRDRKGPKNTASGEWKSGFGPTLKAVIPTTTPE